MPMLQPGKTKFHKEQRGRLRGTAATGNTLHFGEYGMQSMETAFLTVNQIEAARKALTHFFKRSGKIWVRVLADKPYSSRPAETRMGGGKGAPEYFVARVRRGHILFEVSGVKQNEAEEGFRLASFKLPVKVRLVKA